MALGHAFHEFVLEPEVFAGHYVVPPKVDRRTKAGKDTWAEWEANNAGKALLEKGEADDYERMRASIMAHPTARELLAGKGFNEVSLIWPDEKTGLACKGRIDRITQFGGYSWIVDLKTSKDAAENSFKWDASRYGYHRASAWYRRGLAVVKPGPLRRACYVVVEKEPPFAVAVHEADERALEQGDREMTAWLDQYAECLESGEWPGYPLGMGLIDYPPNHVDEVM
jgi:exodeoxyribonuclease VIII